VCVAGGGGGDLKPQALEIHELVWADLLGTVARKLATDNRGGGASGVAKKSGRLT
jgi:hypothetical protein